MVLNFDTARLTMSPFLAEKPDDAWSSAQSLRQSLSQRTGDL
jgi:hypothetical protein